MIYHRSHSKLDVTLHTCQFTSVLQGFCTYLKMFRSECGICTQHCCRNSTMQSIYTITTLSLSLHNYTEETLRSLCWYICISNHKLLAHASMQA